MSKICSRCGTENKDDAGYCMKCGQPLPFVSSPSSPTPASSGPLLGSAASPTSPMGEPDALKRIEQNTVTLIGWVKILIVIVVVLGVLTIVFG